MSAVKNHPDERSTIHIGSTPLPRSERLRSLGAVRRLFTEGEGGFVYPFRYMYHVTKPRTECAGKADAAGVVPDHVDNSPGGRAEGSIEVLFSVPKKFHKRANRRNLLKRRTREAYRLSREALRRSVREAGRRDRRSAGIFGQGVPILQEYSLCRATYLGADSYADLGVSARCRSSCW